MIFLWEIEFEYHIIIVDAKITGGFDIIGYKLTWDNCITKYLEASFYSIQNSIIEELIFNILIFKGNVTMSDWFINLWIFDDKWCIHINKQHEIKVYMFSNENTTWNIAINIL